MTRAELVTLLANLVERRGLAQAEADRLLALYDRGELLPADLPQGTGDDDDSAAWLAALAMVLLLVNVRNARRKLPQATRQRARDLLRADFDDEMAQLARRVRAGNLTVQAWFREMQDAVAAYARQMAVAGAGQLPRRSTRTMVEAQLRQQWPYLRRFATQQLAREVVERPMSEAAIASRARRYGVVAWGMFFEAQAEGATAGMVERWITRDDKFVCYRCGPRHLQFYLPGRGPMPGRDCLGVCRCERVPEYNPEIYAELTGRRRAA